MASPDLWLDAVLLERQAQALGLSGERYGVPVGGGGGVSRQGGSVQGLPPTHESGTASVLRGVVAWHDATEAVIVGKLRAGETPTPADWRAHSLVEQALFYLEAAVTPEQWAEAMA